MHYRPDIDGLRAVAVLAVLFYHADIPGFSGGFVGVDVFFVISGYLITSKIISGIQAGKFSIIGFYEKRIRRIYPALFTVVILVLIAGAWLYDPSTYRELGQSTTATTIFLSNVFFWTQAGYFESPSSLKPLLHMWSLSVEEQFYLFLPISLVLMFRFKEKAIRGILTAVAFISLAANLIIMNQNPEAGFFLTYGRIWELLIGSILALSKPPKLTPSQGNTFSIIGLLLILASTTLYSDQTYFPGLAAALPVAGSALIIFIGIKNKSVVKSLLSTSPLVFIGKISYSLYLWHWPLLVFTRVYLIRPLGAVELSLWLAATFLFSTLSWKFIETPFRSGTFLSRAKIFALAGTVMALTAVAGVIIHFTHGLPARFTKEEAEFLRRPAWNWESAMWPDCEAGEDYSLEESSPCTFGEPEQAKEFILWGDSHANAVASAVNLSATNAGKSGYFIWKTGCSPLLGINRSYDRDQDCSSLNDSIIDFLEFHSEIKQVILVGRWTILFEGNRFKNEEGYTVELVDSDNQQVSSPDNRTLFVLGLERTLKELSRLEKEVIIVSPIPEVGFHVPSAYFTSLRTGRDIDSLIAPTRTEFLNRNNDVIDTLQNLADQYPRVSIVDPAQILCTQQICQVVIDNKPLYIDDDHLSTFGAYSIAEIFDPVFSSE